MVAAKDGRRTCDLGELPVLDPFHPGAKAAEHDVVLGFAGHGAGVAANALAIVDDEAVVHRIGEPAQADGSWEAITVPASIQG